MSTNDDGPPVAPTGAADHHVAILGSHLASGLLAAVLARQGLRVLLVDAPDDGMLAAGDSTVPYTTAVLHLLAERFDVPEIARMAHFEDLPEPVRRPSGIKKSLAFLHHTAGQRQDPAHAVQFHVPGEHSEWHLYRPAVDAHARELAVQYGARVMPDRATVTAAQAGAGEVTLTFSNGEVSTAQFVVDAGGTEPSLLSGAGAAREGTRLRSRVLHAHLRGVKPFEECARLSDYPRATAWSRGTVHHVFDGGWVQVVDFRNHPSATSDLCSEHVGLDPERFDDLPSEPEAALRALVSRFPSLRDQFAGAQACGPWVAEAHWQRRAGVTHGPRWIAMERSASRTDEFLSRDVTMVAEMVHALGAALPRAVRDEAAGARELARVAAFQESLIDFNDRMLAAARTACGSFPLWNAYTRVWLLWQILAHLSLKRATNEAVASGSWEPVERFEGGGLWFRTPDGLSQLLDWFFALFDEVRAGRRGQAEAADMIFRKLRRARFVPPLYRFGDPAARYYHFTLPRRLLMLAWVMTIAPRDFKRLLTRDNVTGRRERAQDSAAAGTGGQVVTQPGGR